MKSTTPSTTVAPYSSIVALRIGDAIFSLIDTFDRWNTARKTEKVLSSLTNAQLSDIGLSRGEIANISAIANKTRF